MLNTRNKKLKALVVGYGSVGRRHAENLRALGVREIFFLRHKSTEDLPPRHLRSWSEALKTKPDFAIIANPTSLHIPAALRLAAAGIHLFMEKPLSHNLVGVTRLLNLVNKKHLITMVGYNFRFHPQLLKIKKLLQEGAIGKVVGARAEAGQYLPDWHPGEDYRQGYAACAVLGGGVILTLIHEIDYLIWLIGAPQAIFCLADKISNLKIDVEDVAEILIKFSKGTTGEVHLDYLQRIPRRTLEIIGEQGTILWNYFDGELKVFTVKNKKWKTYSLPRDFERNQMFMDEMKHFISCLRQRKGTIIPIAVGLLSLKMALAAKKSAKTGKLLKL